MNAPAPQITKPGQKEPFSWGRELKQWAVLILIALDDGTRMKPKGWQHVPAGRRLVLQLPGGGGHGDPALRSEAARAEDATRGYVAGDSE